MHLTPTLQPLRYFLYPSFLTLDLLFSDCIEILSLLYNFEASQSSRRHAIVLEPVFFVSFEFEISFCDRILKSMT